MAPALSRGAFAPGCGKLMQNAGAIPHHPVLSLASTGCLSQLASSGSKACRLLLATLKIHPPGRGRPVEPCWPLLPGTALPVIPGSSRVAKPVQPPGKCPSTQPDGRRFGRVRPCRRIRQPL